MYKGLKFASCEDCHTDPHNGAFKNPCESCHVTSGWKQVPATGIGAQFDHDKTNFPLRGKHRTVDCGACHHSGDFKAPIPYKLCSDCHKPDPHNGQFAKRKGGDMCESCHTVDGWKPSTFTVKDHATSGYPLEGGHIRVACAKCHIPKGTATLFKVKFAHCTDCHKDEHTGQFAAPPWSNRCESCHTVKTFAPSTFTIAKHQKSRFVLAGAHLAVPCADCHSAKKGFPKTTAPFHFANMSCIVCHEDVHRGQFKELMSKKSHKGAGCEACHSVVDWKDLSAFDHNQTEFPLTGSHQTVGCIDCHKPPNLETDLRQVTFKSAPKDCESCHQDVHARQFARDGANPKCETCHVTTRWKPSLFDHEKTAFSLKGAHERVKCGDCHKNFREVNGKRVLFYLPTPKECVACHGAKLSGLGRAYDGWAVYLRTGELTILAHNH
jgi:nitrate/TMAO reductase-like tetraheme cytochrome c subunit